MTDSAQFPKVPEVRTLLTRLGFGESPRWHEGRLGFPTGACRRSLPLIWTARARSSSACQLPFHFVLTGCTMGDCWCLGARGACPA